MKICIRAVILWGILPNLTVLCHHKWPPCLNVRTLQCSCHCFHRKYTSNCTSSLYHFWWSSCSHTLRYWKRQGIVRHYSRTWHSWLHHNVSHSVLQENSVLCRLPCFTWLHIRLYTHSQHKCWPCFCHSNTSHDVL